MLSTTPQGAARLEALKAWSSLTGFSRGLPALAADLIKHRTWVGVAAEQQNIGSQSLEGWEARSVVAGANGGGVGRSDLT